jgi:hypothetical protein
VDGTHGTPPFIWGDRYDLAGVVLGATVLCVPLLVDASVWAAIPLGAATMNLAAYLLRRRAGVPQMFL